MSSISPILKMASSSRVFCQSFRFASNLKLSGSKVQTVVKSVNALNVSTVIRKLSNAQLARPLASVSGVSNGLSKCMLKTKVSFAPQQGANTILVARSAVFITSSSQGLDESSTSTSEGSDSSCEAMEGPHGDDDGLVITNNSTGEDL